VNTARCRRWRVASKERREERELRAEMSILGINAYHRDACAAIVPDGNLIAAVEEERFNRTKHWAGFPAQSIRWCLKKSDIHARELDHVAPSFNPQAKVRKRLAFVVAKRPSIRAVVDRVRRQGRRLGLVDRLAEAVGAPRSVFKARVHRVRGRWG